MKKGVVFLIGLSLAASAARQVHASERMTCQPEGLFLDGHTHMGFAVDSSGRVDTSSLGFLSDRCFCAAVFVMPVDRTDTDDLVGRLTNEIEQLERLAADQGSFTLADSADDVREQCDSEGLAVLLSLEYFAGILDDKPQRIDEIARLGIVSITLVNNPKDPLMADVSGDSRLTELGKQVIRRMNEARVLIDLSHLEEEEMLAVIEHSTSAVIASHSNPASAGNSRSELSDEIIAAVTRKGGLINISFNTSDLYDGGNIDIGGVEKLVDHIDHIRRIAGIQHVGLGSDLQAFGKYVPKQLARTDTLSSIRSELEQRGYSESEITMVFGENFLRLWDPTSN